MSSKATWMLSAMVSAAFLSESLLAVAAGSPVERPARSVEVHFADLNLGRAEGAASLYQRLSVAADQVCSSRAFTGLYYTYADYRACVAEVLGHAVAQVHQPSLTQLAQAHGLRMR